MLKPVYVVRAVLTLLVMSPLFVWAAVEGAVEPPAVDVALSGLITAAIPLLIPFVVYGVRLAIPKVPRVALPFIAMALGAAADWLAKLAIGGESSLITGALLGAAAVVVRDVYSTLKEHGLKS